MNKKSQHFTENVLDATRCAICAEERIEDNATTDFYVFEKCCHGMYLCTNCVTQLNKCPMRCFDQQRQAKKRVIVYST